ncbi:MAG: DUF998 domain-containing protein [Candidatus Thorarchaeota archaeon]|nr:MAG: DUF998 domain-containing protein [Candidatus Thorarchaeota archaeon]
MNSQGKQIMKSRFANWPLTSLSGIFVILLYCSFTFASWAFYPDLFGPTTHYLSRLGNFNYSPFGAYFYNLGCILTGLALFPFFIGLYEWYTDRLYQKMPLIVGQVIGILSAIALVMIGVFSEDQGSPHMTASSTFFLLNFFVLIIVNAALLLHTRFTKLVALYAFAIDILSLSFELTIGGPITEWFTVFGALLYVAFISFSTIQLRKRPEGTNAKTS